MPAKNPQNKPVFLEAAYQMIEGATGPDNLRWVLVDVPAQPQTILHIGRILIACGQLHKDLCAYTRCLIAFNGNEPFPERTPELKRVLQRFRMEADIAFSNLHRIRDVCRKLKERIDKVKEVRDRLSHGQLHAGLYSNQVGAIVATFDVEGNSRRSVTWDDGTLSETAQEFALCHGRVLQLALCTTAPIHHTQPEQERLQAIVKTGYWNFPNLPERREPRR